ncbi:MAG: ABC transporter ATP-binding protein [Planctomycetota bacterium]|jgi:ABC-type lipoprotein export system ATPase subunit
MIEISRVKFTYGREDFRLHIDDFAIAAGTKTALVGPSGSGKTTFLNLVSGIILPGAGGVCVDGLEVSSLNDTERRAFRITNIGFVFQDFELLEYLDVLDNILHPFRINRALCLMGEVRNRALQLVEETGLSGKLRRSPGQLSQGERQRVAICRALLTQPKMLLADEPTGNLDPRNKDRILDLLFQYAEASGATVLVVTHDTSLLERFDRVVDFQDFHTEAAV